MLPAVATLPSLGSSDSGRAGFFFVAAGPEAMRSACIGAGKNEMGTAEFAEGAEDGPQFILRFLAVLRALRALRGKSAAVH